jgi:hypothetical protein
MRSSYHIRLTAEALGPFFSPQALEAIFAANLGQDSLAGLLWHPEYHFDDSLFERGEAYLEAQRSLVLAILKNRLSQGSPERSARSTSLCSRAWSACGRLLHAAQDFYAHSNYAALYVAQAASLRSLPPEEIDPLDPTILNHPRLRSGRAYLPWEALVYLPGLGRLVKHLLPRDAHAWMNLDHPGQGELFPYALAAARKRTTWEYEHLANRILENLGPQALACFQGYFDEM